MKAAPAGRWLLLIHQIPPRPAYLRVKVGRRLQALGAVAVKSSVYVLPRSDDSREDFQWVVREIAAGGGDASVCEARFVEGLSDSSVEALFHSAREADYAALTGEVRKLESALTRGRRPTSRTRQRAASGLGRLRRRIEEIARIDFFGAPGRGEAEAALAALERSLRPDGDGAPERPDGRLERPRGRRWVTRAGVRVDRIASAWLIKRFIDPEARFGFVAGSASAPRKGDLRFDMFEAEFTHEGEQCTFEVLLRRFGIDDPALAEIGEIVHDIDLKDARFSRAEAAGFARLIAGIALRHTDDEARIAAGSEVLEALYASFRGTAR